MLSKIKLQNFQKHKSLELELKSGINAIVGESDSGKTAIIRALNNLFFNSGSLKNYLTYEKEKGFVEVEIDDQKIKKGFDGLNFYSFKNKKFEAVNKDIPTEIKIFLNLSEINIQNQFDNPFLIGLTGGQAIKKINNFIRLDLSDYFLKVLNSKKRDIKKQIEDLKIETEEKEKQIKDYNGLEENLRELEKLKRINQDYLKKTEIFKNLSLKTNQFFEIQSKLEKYKDIEKELEKINLPAFENEIKSLENKIEVFRKQKQKIMDFLNVQNKLKKIETLNIQEKEKLLIRLEKGLQSIKEKKEIISKVKNFLIALDKKTKLEKELNNLKTKLPKTCPLCGNPIKEIDL